MEGRVPFDPTSGELPPGSNFFDWSSWNIPDGLPAQRSSIHFRISKRAKMQAVIRVLPLALPTGAVDNVLCAFSLCLNILAVKYYKRYLIRCGSNFMLSQYQ